MQTASHYPWLLMPVIFIVTAVLAFNYVGDGIRDAADQFSQADRDWLNANHPVSP